MPWYAEVPVDAWPARIRARGSDAEVLYAAFARGDLDDHADGPDLCAWDRALGALFQALGGTPHLELEQMASEEREIRRWCWTPGWVLLSQDEDLLLMDAPQAPWLLDEARRGCPKRSDALQIVAHGVRDRLHHALWEDGVAAELEATARLLPLARHTGDPELIAYLERIVSYAESRSVSSFEVLQRVRDLRRCHPGSEHARGIERRGSQWCVPLARANLSPGTLHVDVDSGRMFARED